MRMLYFNKHFMRNPCFKSSYVMVGLTQHKIYWNTLLFKYLLNFRTKCCVWSRVNINSQPEFSTHEMWIVLLSVYRKKIFLFLYHTEIKCFLIAPILLNQKASFISVFKWKKTLLCKLEDLDSGPLPNI